VVILECAAVAEAPGDGSASGARAKDFTGIRANQDHHQHRPQHADNRTTTNWVEAAGQVFELVAECCTSDWFGRIAGERLQPGRGNRARIPLSEPRAWLESPGQALGSSCRDDHYLV
jgi:hypothetical protein